MKYKEDALTSTIFTQLGLYMSCKGDTLRSTLFTQYELHDIQGRYFNEYNFHTIRIT